MSDIDEYSIKSKYYLKYGPIIFLLRMRVLSMDEAIEMFDIINKMKWKRIYKYE